MHYIMTVDESDRDLSFYDDLYVHKLINIFFTIKLTLLNTNTSTENKYWITEICNCV